MKGCAGCHQSLKKAGEDPARLDAGVQTYGQAFHRFVSRAGGLYVDVPKLSRLSRFRSSWLKRFLTEPYDLRPHLRESMIRHNLSKPELDALIEGLGARKDLAPPGAPKDLSYGERLFEENGCPACHLFGGKPFATPSVAGRARALAPDLAHTRDRLNWDTVFEAIRDPRGTVAHEEMPGAPALNAGEIAAIANFIYFAKVPARREAEPAPPPPPTDAGTPSYEEVEARVFRKVCWHCHSNADFNEGDGMPGNTGGFGFGETGLSFASYAEVMDGSIDAHGERQSIFRKGKSGASVLVERLRLRKVENGRDLVSPGRKGETAVTRPVWKGERGMPLGLPALSDEEIALVDRWVRGGRPGPKPGGRALPGRMLSKDPAPPPP